MSRFEQLSDRQLVEYIVSGNHEAFAVLYHRYKNMVYYSIVKLSHGDYYMAEEVVQATFIKLWESRKNIMSDYPVYNYIKVISRNYFLKATARRLHEELMESGLVEEVAEGENYVDDEVELNFLMEEIERIIDQLPPTRQHVYRLRHIEHLSQKEIAEKLDISENTVESHLKYSTKFLQLMLRSHRDQINSMFLLFLFSFLI
ncbi:MAG: sigma-70 family RNA polymerase sigma factor [Tannerellaceae bacterium]|nr:sigma-70 family RNA polymerase sigma factor [Tannerellaceae bacterium]